MAKPKYRIEGISLLRRKLARTDPTIRIGVRTEVANLARHTRDYARGHVGSISSNIAGAISDRIDRDGMGATVGIITQAARRRAWYAHFVEWGTRPSSKTRHPGLPARPFLTPAWEQAKAELEPRLKRAVDDMINQIAKIT